MNKDFYFFANHFLRLSIAAALLQSILFLLLRSQLFFLESFVNWFFVVNAIILVATLFMLKYYHNKKYWFTFFTATIATVTFICELVVSFETLVERALENYYIPVVLVNLGANILYAISLMFLCAGKRSRLKTAGILMFIIGLILLAVRILYLNLQDNEVKGMLDKIQAWTILAGSLVPVLFIINFRDEARRFKAENVNTTMRKSLQTLLTVAGLSALGLTIAFGFRIAGDSYWSLYWGKRIFEQTQEMAKLFEARTFVSSKGDTLLYRLLKPMDYDTKKKYPIVVNLPYGGQPGTDKIRQMEGAAAAQLLSSDINRKKYPAFLFVPNCPSGAGWGGIPNYPTVDTLVFEAIDALEEEEFGIDVKRCYVTGISRGGYGSWHFISTRPKMFAAAIPVCGEGDPQLASNIVDVSVWAFHGEKDKNVPVSGSRDMIEAIKKAGGHPRYTEFRGEGHNIWNQVTETPGLWDWLFAQKRN